MAAHFFGYWAATFVTLCLGLVLLTVFYRLIDSELGLHGLGKEAALASVASFFQGAGVWLIFTYAPGAGRAMIIPGLIVAILYKLVHMPASPKVYEKVIRTNPPIASTIPSRLDSGRGRLHGLAWSHSWFKWGNFAQ